MSVFGIDLGNLYSTVSIARRKGIDIVINEVSKRETSTYISFGGDKEGRMVGEKGADMKVRNFRNTVNNLKRLVGLRYDSAECQRELQHCLFRTAAGSDGYLVVEVEFNGETQHFRPEQLIAMMLSKLSSYADREANADAGSSDIKLVDFVLSCPPYYSAFQRKLLAQASEVAGLKCLTLVTEGTAVALGWGIFQQGLPEKEEDGLVVQFCDVGHSATYISTVRFWKGNMKVLSHIYDKQLGCRDFDVALADHFRKEIQAKYKIDVYEQKKARLRLIAACEKLRYTLSANPEVSLNVESIMDDIDVSFPKYKRSEFNELTAPLWKRVEALVARAAGAFDPEKLHAVEVVGGGSYMPQVRELLSEAFKRPVSSTMNVSEAVAKGCGIVGAILSPRVRVDFQVVDALVHDIMLGYQSQVQAEASAPVSFLPDVTKQSVLYGNNSEFPKVYDLTFDRASPFSVYVYYGEPCAEVQESNGGLLLGHWSFEEIPPFKNLQGDVEGDKPVKVVVRFRLNSSGFVTVDSACVNEEYEEVVPAKEGEGEAATKHRTRRIDVAVRPKFVHGLTPDQVADLRKQEVAMYTSDQLLLQTQDAKNALEGYAYEFRSKAEEGGELHDFMTDAVRTEFKKQCDAMIDWVYGEGEDTTKDAYTQKLTELRKHGDAARNRKRLREELPFVFEETEVRVRKVSDEARRLLDSDTHIGKDKLQEIVKKAAEAHDFLKKEKRIVDDAPKAHDVLLTPYQLTSKAAEVENFARPIFATPKPAPPAAPKDNEAKADKPADSAAPEHKPEPGMDVD